MTDDRPLEEREREKTVLKDLISKSRFGICFLITDKQGNKGIETEIGMVTYGHANLNEFTTLTDRAIKQMKQIIEDSINKQIDDSCPSCDRRHPFDYSQRDSYAN